MAIGPAAHFGPYEIHDSIGAGGMGVVYRATDTKLKREVAIKVLPASLASDTERLARFQREAELLASLNHPNVAQIHGLEESDGTTALILELVEGPTLADRIAEGPLPVDEALEIALQIAEALEAAHGQGIVHRDLKPANIKLKDNGLVKVLDFGIAKALDIRAASGLSPVMETPTVTETGIILGTAAYMSPEQARGKGVDQRTDIWAFGCVLYEMLTGQQAFGGEDVTVMLARILEREPDMDALSKTVPPAVRHTIEVCLRKDPHKRIADIRDVKLSVGGALVPAGLVEAGLVSEQRGWRPPLPTAVAATILGIAVAGAIARTFWPTPEPRLVSRFTYTVPSDHRFRGVRRPVLALSPDGRHFVYNTTDGLYLRRMDALEARLIPGTEEDRASPFFSPDGQNLAYWADADQQLKRIPVTGGVPIAITSLASNVWGATWAEDGTILYGQVDGIYRVSADGGAPERVIENEAETGRIYGPQLLPDGDSVLYSRAIGSVSTDWDWDGAQMIVESLSTGEQAVLPISGGHPRYLPTGHLVYAIADTLFGVAFDADRRTASGSAVLLVQGIERAFRTGAPEYGVADNGTLIYRPTEPVRDEERTIVWVDREGREETLLAAGRSFNFARLSPDGELLALDLHDDRSQDIWIYDRSRGTERRLTTGAANELDPAWTWNGQRVAFRNEDGIYWTAVDSPGTPEPLVTYESGFREGLLPYSFSPDNEYLIFGGIANQQQGHDLFRFSLRDRESVPLVEDKGAQYSARVSPDGRWLAYTSLETGRPEIFVRTLADGPEKWLVSTDGGAYPEWSSDGRELFFWRDGMLVAVNVESEPTEPIFRWGSFEELFPMSNATGDYDIMYSVADGGERFAMLKITTDVREDVRPQIIIVEHWFEELERLRPPSQ